MKRASLLAIVVVLAMAQQVSAADNRISLSCNDSALARFQAGQGYVWSTFVGVRLSDGKKVVVEHYFGYCAGGCDVEDSVFAFGILWKNHIATVINGSISDHAGGCL